MFAVLPSLRRLLVIVAAAGLVFGGAAASGQDIIRVEEDWELVVLNPDSSTESPQVTCILSPLGHVGGLHMAFEVNHRTQPSFSGGGTQLQVWSGGTLWNHRNGPNYGRLQHNNETVRWTQQMRLSGGSLEFEIVNGSSQSWGSFGGQGYLRATATTSLSNLNQYSPSVSTAHSGVGYASNRVDSLVLREVRRYSSAGLVEQDTTLRVVHQQQD
jgi:hypothetical protein